MSDNTSPTLESTARADAGSDPSWPLPGPKPVTARRVVCAAALAVVFAGGMAALVRYDLDIARWRDQVDTTEAGGGYWTRGAMMRGFRAFGEFVAIPAILIAVVRLDRRRRIVLAHALFALLLAWAAQAAGKASVERLRPVAYEGADWAGMWQGVGFAIRPAAHSAFPSGHTTVAFAFGLTLAWFYPPLRPLFWLLAIGCGVSRIAHGAHWPSDCWAGAWLGYAVAWVTLRPHWFAPLAAWWDGLWRRRSRHESRFGPSGDCM